MSVSNIGFKQVLCGRGGPANGVLYSVIWLPIRDLKIGAVGPKGTRIIDIYPIIHYACLNCQKICSPEVSRCLCEKNK